MLFRSRVYKLPRPGDIVAGDWEPAARFAGEAAEARDDEELMAVVREAQPFIASLVRPQSAEDADFLKSMAPEEARYVVETALDCFTVFFLKSVREAMKRGIEAGEAALREERAGPPPG